MSQLRHNDQAKPVCEPAETDVEQPETIAVTTDVEQPGREQTRVERLVHTPVVWHVVTDTSQQDEHGNGPLGIAISIYEDDTADAVAWMQEGTEDDAVLMAASPELKRALQKFVAFHDADHEAMKGHEVQAMYDDAIKCAKAALGKVV